MSLKFFRIPVVESHHAEVELNSFCVQNRIARIEKHFVPDGIDSFWAVCVTCDDAEGAIGSKRGISRKNRVDYKELLSVEDFAIYSSLRELRKTLAERDGVPAYSVLTNEQLAAMVEKRITGLSAMQQLNGVGKARVEKYGRTFTEKLVELLQGEAGGAEKTDNTE